MSSVPRSGSGSPPFRAESSSGSGEGKQEDGFGRWRVSSLVPTTLEQGHWVTAGPGPHGGGGGGWSSDQGCLSSSNPQGSVGETEAQGAGPAWGHTTILPWSLGLLNPTPDVGGPSFPA